MAAAKKTKKTPTQKAVSAGEGLLESTTKLIKEYPKTSVGIGLGLGAIGGMLLGKEGSLLKSAVGRASLGDRAGESFTGALFSALESNDPYVKQRAQKLKQKHLELESLGQQKSTDLAKAITDQKTTKLRVGPDNFQAFSTSSAKGKNLLAEAARPILEQRTDAAFKALTDTYNSKPIYKRIFSHKPTLTDVQSSDIKSVTFNANKERANAARKASDIEAFKERARVGLDKPGEPSVTSNVKQTKPDINPEGASKLNKSSIVKWMRRNPLPTAGIGIGLGLVGGKLFFGGNDNS